jgi:hypothetical protein
MIVKSFTASHNHLILKIIFTCIKYFCADQLHHHHERISNSGSIGSQELSAEREEKVVYVCHDMEWNELSNEKIFAKHIFEKGGG